MTSSNLQYCDYIMHTIILPAMKEDKGIIELVGKVKMDLDPKEGYMLSTTKTLEVQDVNGRQYKITVEAL